MKFMSSFAILLACPIITSCTSYRFSFHSADEPILQAATTPIDFQIIWPQAGDFEETPNLWISLNHDPRVSRVALFLDEAFLGTQETASSGVILRGLKPGINSVRVIALNSDGIPLLSTARSFHVFHKSRLPANNVIFPNNPKVWLIPDLSNTKVWVLKTGMQGTDSLPYSLKVSLSLANQQKNIRTLGWIVSDQPLKDKLCARLIWDDEPLDFLGTQMCL